jgi:GDP-4-dehydro-6-deoxy-D-mannose reductase
MEKVLVTGINGFVGQHLAKELFKDGYEVVGIGGPQGNHEQPEFISKYIVVDLMDPEALNSLDLTDIGGVVHLAGLAAVGPSFASPLQYIETNIGIETNLFETAIKQSVYPKFVVVSSGSLYDPTASLPLDEHSNVVPNSPYAVSKIGQEQMAAYYVSRGFKVVIARPFNHIGPGQNLGFIVPDLTHQAVAFENADLDRITVGNLDAKRDYTDVRDIARAYRLLLEKGQSSETYNICTGRSVSGHEILQQILDTADVHPEITQDPAKMRPSDAPDIYGDCSKLNRDTGWQSEISLAQTITDVVADWRSRS